MNDLFLELIQLLKTEAFFCGLGGIILSTLLLLELFYLFFRRNEVMTLTYGLTLISVFIFLLLCIFVVLLASIYAITAT